MPLFGNTLRVSQLTRRFGGMAEALGVQVETASLIQRMNPAPTMARVTLINNLIVSLKSAGVWAKLDLFYVLAAHDAQAARLNWKANAYNLTEVNSPTFTSDRGYQGNGSSSYLNTGWVPSTNGVQYVQNGASIWIWSRTSAGSASPDAGSITTPPTARLLARNASDTMQGRINDAITYGQSNANGSGFIGIQRRGASDRRFWRNGSQVGVTDTTASTGVPAEAQWLCGNNSGGFSSRQLAVGAWGSSLSGLESEFYTALNTYMTAVGAA